MGQLIAFPSKAAPLSELEQMIARMIDLRGEKISPERKRDAAKKIAAFVTWVRKDLLFSCSVPGGLTRIQADEVNRCLTEAVHYTANTMAGYTISALLNLEFAGFWPAPACEKQ